MEARIKYREHFAPVQECGFITNDDYSFVIGYSDGLVSDDGLIECKSRRQKFQVETILTDQVPAEYMLQLQTGLLVTGVVNNGKTTIIITGTTYTFDNQKLKLTNTEINLDGARIKDLNGNEGVVRGALTHRLFRDFGVDAVITGNNVVALNTTRADNPDYYGYGVGQVTAEFKGLFDKMDMRITAVTGPGTKLSIPVEDSELKLDQSFIKFVKKDGKGANPVKKPQKVPGGINIEMNLSITPDAEVSIIFNESKGDIMRGTGRGNMKIDVTRQGDEALLQGAKIENLVFETVIVKSGEPMHRWKNCSETTHAGEATSDNPNYVEPLTSGWWRAGTPQQSNETEER